MELSTRLTPEESNLVSEQDALLAAFERETVYEVKQALSDVAQRFALPIATDDRYARFEAALVRLLIQSRKEG